MGSGLHPRGGQWWLMKGRSSQWIEWFTELTDKLSQSAQLPQYLLCAGHSGKERGLEKPISQSFNKHVLSTLCVPSSMSQAHASAGKHTAMNKMDTFVALPELLVWVGA